MEILHRDDLPQGGFAGLREHRLVMGSKVYGDRGEPDNIQIYIPSAPGGWVSEVFPT